MQRLVGEGRRDDEGARLERRAAGDLGVHEADDAGEDLLEELLVQAGAQQLEVPLVRHVQPDALVLEPARREGHHAADLHGLPLEAGADLVHLELVVVQVGGGHGLVHGELVSLGLVLERLHVARRPLEEERQHLGVGVALDLDGGQAAARHGACQLEVGDAEAEVGGRDLLVGVGRVRERARDALVHAREHLAEDAGGLAQLGGGPRREDAAERGLRLGAVALERVVHLVPVVEVLAARAQQVELRADGGEQRAHLLGQARVAAELVGDGGDEVDDLVQLVGRGHLGAEERGQAVHGVVPAGLARLHLDAHAERVEDAELVGGEDGELRHDAHLHLLARRRQLEGAARRGVADEVGLGVDLLQLRRLLERGDDRVVLPDLLVGHELVLLRAVGHAAGREEEGDARRVVEHVLLLVGEDGEEVPHEVEVVREVVRPEAVLRVLPRGHLLGVLGHEVEHELAVGRDLDAGERDVLEELAGAEGLAEHRAEQHRAGAGGHELRDNLRDAVRVLDLEECVGHGQLVVAVGLRSARAW